MDLERAASVFVSPASQLHNMADCCIRHILTDHQELSILGLLTIKVVVVSEKRFTEGGRDR